MYNPKVVPDFHNLATEVQTYSTKLIFLEAREGEKKKLMFNQQLLRKRWWGPKLKSPMYLIAT